MTRSLLLPCDHVWVKSVHGDSRCAACGVWNTPLDRLVAEATVLAGGQHECASLGHDWQTRGGRSCPRGVYGQSQTVYECRACGAMDYGEPGGPGHRDCYEGGPCTGCGDLR